MSGTQLEAAAAGAPNRCKQRLENCMACQVGGGHSLMLSTSRMHPSRNMDPPQGVGGGGGAPLEIVKRLSWLRHDSSSSEPSWQQACPLASYLLPMVQILLGQMATVHG